MNYVSKTATQTENFYEGDDDLSAMSY